MKIKFLGTSSSAKMAHPHSSIDSLTPENSTQFGNDLNYSKFNGENIATNSYRVTVFALDGSTKKHFGHYAVLKIFSLRPPRKYETVASNSFSEAVYLISKPYGLKLPTY